MAATVARNAGTDLRRSLQRAALRHAPLEAAEALHANELVAGLHLAEVRLQFADALGLARAAADRCASRELADLVGALDRIAAGWTIAVPDEASRRRLARGAVRLSKLIAA